MAGRAWTIRRSPHSNAAFCPAAIVRHWSRSTVVPGFVVTSDTTGFGALSTNKASEPESRSDETEASIAFSMTLPAAVLTAVSLTVAIPLSPNASVSAVGATEQVAADPLHTVERLYVAFCGCRFLTKNRCAVRVCQNCCRSDSSGRTATWGGVTG